MSTTPCRYPRGPLLHAPADLDVEPLAVEEVVHVSTAKVALAEYDALQHDFPNLQTENLIALNPELHDLPAPKRQEATHALIDDWLIAHAAFISTAQAAQAIVNTHIEVDTRRTVAYRPPRYGRALVIPMADTDGVSTSDRQRWPATTGLLDIKGAGVPPTKVPVQGRQSNGLEYLALALSDFLIKKIIDEILNRSLQSVWTVPVYAILDLGFDVVGGWQGTGPAGIHVRRAHQRRSGPTPPLEQVVTFEIETTLRRYGLTAATQGGRLHITRSDSGVIWRRGDNSVLIKAPEWIGFSIAVLGNQDHVTLDCRDVQLARHVSWPPPEAQMVDFGAIRVEPAFTCPMIRNSAAPACDEIIWPSDQEFVHPDPTLQLPVTMWNRWDLASFCARLATDFRGGALSAQELRRELDALLTQTVDRWPRQDPR